jgi:hypothetical protein
VILEQGLACAFQYAVDVPGRQGISSDQLAWLASAMGAGTSADTLAKLQAAQPTPEAFDAAVRDVWLSIAKKARAFDAAFDVIGGPQIEDGPSDAKHFENL